MRGIAQVGKAMVVAAVVGLCQLHLEPRGQNQLLPTLELGWVDTHKMAMSTLVACLVWWAT